MDKILPADDNIQNYRLSITNMVTKDDLVPEKKKFLVIQHDLISFFGVDIAFVIFCLKLGPRI